MQSSIESPAQSAQKPPKPLFLRSMLNRWLVSSYKFVYEHSIDGRHGPIKIICVSIPNSRAVFVARAEAALLLLGNFYPRGYRRVCRELDYIVDTPLLSIGQYNHSLRACHIDFARMERYTAGQTEVWATAYLACVILHEATHGHLMSRGIGYGEALRTRVERLCVREEERFAVRLDPQKYPARLVIPFDASHWQVSWTRSRKQTSKEIRARYKHDLRENRKKSEERLSSAPTSFFKRDTDYSVPKKCPRCVLPPS